MSERPLFILAGNGPYQNRGCEAIVRGTVKILRQQYDNPRFICISHFNSKEQYETQRKHEFDGNIQHISSYLLNVHEAISHCSSPKAWKYVYRRFFNRKRLGRSMYGDLMPYLPEANAVLSVGGDNYSLDYGKPSSFTLLDDFVLENNKPLIIWGASVGPFNSDPTYEQYMGAHLANVSGIFARETETIRYLATIGVSDNVYSIADPAFMMDAIEPGIDKCPMRVEPDSIGLNLSPLMAKYVCGGDMQAWLNLAASIIEKVALSTEKQVYLIPHVTIPLNNDYDFMKQALSMIDYKQNIFLVSPTYDAAEIKWIIGRMAFFAGARTHATIAALSMGVPTLSFAYSQKAIGINKDIFGHRDYVIDSDRLMPSNVETGLFHLMDAEDDIKEVLRIRKQLISEKAALGGAYLKKILTRPVCFTP